MREKRVFQSSDQWYAKVLISHINEEILDEYMLT